MLDPQGQTIRSALNGLGHHNVEDVRQGKYFDIVLAAGTRPEEPRKEVEAIAHDVLAIP